MAIHSKEIWITVNSGPLFSFHENNNERSKFTVKKSGPFVSFHEYFHVSGVMYYTTIQTQQIYVFKVKNKNNHDLEILHRFEIVIRLR